MSKKVVFIYTPTPQCAILTLVEHLIYQKTTLISDICFPFYLLKGHFLYILITFLFSDVLRALNTCM